MQANLPQSVKVVWAVTAHCGGCVCVVLATFSVILVCLASIALAIQAIFPVKPKQTACVRAVWILVIGGECKGRMHAGRQAGKYLYAFPPRLNA